MDINQGLAHIRLFLFDLDDTLVHTNTDYELARSKVKDYLVPLGLPRETELKPIIAQIRLWSQRLSRNSQDQQQIIFDCLKIIEKVELESLKNAHLIEGANTTLSFLKNKGLLVGIFSRTSSQAVSKVINKFNLGSFDIVLGRDDLIEPKPHPEGILKAAELLHLKTDQIALVGDHPYDIRSAKAAKSVSIGVLTGVSSKETFEDVHPDFMIDSVSNLPKLFTSS